MEVSLVEVKEAISTRRAYRALKPIKISKALIRDLAENAHLAPSCFNNQPWRYIFVHKPDLLKKLHNTLSRGNRWAYAASMIVVVHSRPDFDCQIKNRNYNLFDTGMATAFLILRATELNLVAHPIAGYDEALVKEILNIPQDNTVITLVIIGKHSASRTDLMTDHQIQAEKTRPPRKPLTEIITIN